MDYLWIMMALLIVMFLIRMRHARRKSRMNWNKGEEIQHKLKQLRQKRDDDNEGV
ncbi:hypothetical protein [Paenibacillus sp. KN14-4R]|uniref:hypothetical protein n=1 Tax=Paenibacillus sp. KN14-4R TaxID=3445773 RepID=UPI003F9F160F